MTAYPTPHEAVPPDAEPTTDRFGRRAMRWSVIAQLANENGWTCGVEVGAADGRCAEAVLSACAGLHMTVIDPWEPQDGHTGPEDWSDWPHAQHEEVARQRLGRFGSRCTIRKGYSADVAGEFADASVDFVFLDGDHGEVGVRADIKAWLPKIRSGGALLIHDINWPSVRGVMDDVFEAYEVAPNNVAIVCIKNKIDAQ
jgi:hypothetical protein